MESLVHKLNLVFASLLWSACANPSSPPAADHARQLNPTHHLPGPELARLYPRVADAGSLMGEDDPLRLEITLPRSVSVAGRGTGATANLGMDSILQIEWPTGKRILVDETDVTSTIGEFDIPHYCPTSGAPCLWDDDQPGRIRVFRRRDDGGAVSITELLSASPRMDPLNAEESGRARRIVGVWMSANAPPLDHRDQITVSYVTRVPGRSTTWLGADLKPRIRFRDTSKVADCDEFDRDCWTALGSDQIQGLEVLPGPPAFLRVNAPLDVVVGEPFDITLSILDTRQNPSLFTGTIQLDDRYGPAVPDLVLQDAWTARATITLTQPGAVSFRPIPLPGTTSVHHWTVAHTSSPVVRLAGDLHSHSGITGDISFTNTAKMGDHRGQFTRAEHAYAYMRDVMGLEFGALSEHSDQLPPVAIEADMEAVFGVGGPCDLTGQYSTDLFDWWSDSQRITAEAEVDGFLAFPAYEWHGVWKAPGVDARLHKIVLYRDHAPALDHPILPIVDQRAPQCLFAFLETKGLTTQMVTVLPHMMRNKNDNLDWDLTYTPTPELAAIASRDAADRWQSVGEMFSARAPIGHSGFERLTAFEGTREARAPYAFRRAWRDLDVMLGIIGSSDGHTQMPGSDDPRPAGGGARDHTHDDGGLAFVVAQRTPRPRDGVFEALQARTTYGSSGPRVWMDMTLTKPDGSIARMGAEVQSDACTLDLHAELLAGLPIRELIIWSTQVGTDGTYDPLGKIIPNTDRAVIDMQLANPVAPGEAGLRMLYYARGFMGPILDKDLVPEEVQAAYDEAAWTSPIWVDWTACASP